VKLLVDRSDVEADSTDIHSQTPPPHGAVEGHGAVVNLLLEGTILRITPKGGGEWIPLLWQ
jgi:hypothetical protein